MDKEYMLRRVLERLDILEAEYNSIMYDDNRSVATRRCHIKRDICILTLVEHLLMACADDVFIEDDIAITGLDKLLKE